MARAWKLISEQIGRYASVVLRIDFAAFDTVSIYLIVTEYVALDLDWDLVFTGVSVTRDNISSYQVTDPDQAFTAFSL